MGTQPQEGAAEGAWAWVTAARATVRTGEEVARAVIEDMQVLAGDRAVCDDAGVLTGVGRLGPHRVAFAAQRRTAPEMGGAGFRKVRRILEMAERFGLAMLTFVDVRGNHRVTDLDGPMWLAVGQSLEAFARTPARTLGVLCGPGVSGGALALCLTDQLVALSPSYLAAIDPEAAAAILWRNPSRAPQAAALLRLDHAGMIAAGLAPTVLPEGSDGAAIKRALHRCLDTPVPDRRTRWLGGQS